MKTTIFYIAGLTLAGAMGCTSLSEGQQNLPPGPPVAERVRYLGEIDSNIRRGMDEQASEINRKRNIEQFDRNGPAMTPPTLRPQQVRFAPIDSTRHNIYWPIRPVIRPIRVN